MSKKRSVALVAPAVLCLIFAFGAAESLAQDVREIELKTRASGFEITRDSGKTDVLRIRTALDVLTAKATETKEGAFLTLGAAGMVKVFGQGEPNLPVFSRLLEVPLEADVAATVVSFDEEVVDLEDLGILQKIIPAQPSVSKGDDPAKLPFFYDAEAYGEDRFVETETVVFEDLGIMRSRRLVRIEVRPIQYNPVQNELRILNNLVVEVEFLKADHSKSQRLRSGYSSELFDRLLERGVTNFEAKTEQPKAGKVTYVIVADRMFEATLQPFVTWKEILGFHVIEGYTDEPHVGATAASIKQYLKGLYDSPSAGVQPPEYVLLVGDVAQIPAHDGTTSTHVTDLYYCEYTGDVLPDAFYGRFSAETVAQLQPQIDKTLEYEQYTMPDPSYITDAVMVAGEDADYAPTWGNGQINYGTKYYFNPAQGITSHTYLQPEPSGGDYSQKIQQDVSNGAGFANYTAHCSSNGWADPAFSVADVYDLTNSHKYGLWVGNCCKSSRFDSTECFAEAALRASGKGAVGYIGGSNNTNWDEDFWWSVGFKAVSANPAYDANELGAYDRLFHTHGEPAADWYSTQGQMFVAGNLAVNGSTSHRKTYYWEIYHLMGDPSVEIRTRIPSPLTVVHPSVAPASNNEFIVAVKHGNTMIPGATVALVKDGVVVDSKVTAATFPDRGTVTFSFNLSPGPIAIHVTKPNYVPYEGSCTLVVGSGELWISFDVGATLPFDDWYQDTFCFNYIANLEYRFSSIWAIVLEVGYNDFRLAGEHFPWWNVSPTLRYYRGLSDRVDFFVNVGPGLYLPEDGGGEVGFKAGLGVDYPVGDRLKFELGTDYHQIPEVDGGSFQHFHVGVAYKVKGGG